MSLRIQNNVEAFNAHRNLQPRVDEAVEVDGAALVRLPHQPRGRRRRRPRHLREDARPDPRPGPGQRNTQDGISLVQTAEGALDEVHSMLQRVRELAVQYKNGTLDANAKRDPVRGQPAGFRDRAHRHDGGVQRHQAAERRRGTISFQVGANDGEQIGVATYLPGASSARPTFACARRQRRSSDIDAAIDNVSGARAAFGAVQNRLEHTLTTSASYQENLTASESRIRDVDMAEEMVKLTKNQILPQAGTAMLAQANQAPQSVLRLLQ